MGKKGRIAYIDIVKGFAICAVVMMHIEYTFPKSNLIDVKSLFGYFWHVPVFFVVAGFFIKDSKLDKPWHFIKGKLKGLYLPALYIYLLVALLHNVFFSIGWYSSDVSYGGKIISVWGSADFIKNILFVIGCAGREPIVGAMWFVYVLFFSLIGFSLLTFLIKKITKNEKSYEGLRFVIFMMLQLCSCMLTNKYEVTIPRFSNAISAMLLIYVGQQIHQRFEWKFDNGYIALACTLFVYQGTLLMGNGMIKFNENAYNDMMQLTLGSIAALYVLCYVSRKIENNIIGKIIN